MWLVTLLRIQWVSGLISCKVMGFPNLCCCGCPRYVQANVEIVCILKYAITAVSHVRSNLSMTNRTVI
jgi:hypothetical protein